MGERISEQPILTAEQLEDRKKSAMYYLDGAGYLCRAERKRLSDAERAAREKVKAEEEKKKRAVRSAEGASFGLSPIGDGESLAEYRSKISAARKKKRLADKLAKAEARDAARRAKLEEQKAELEKKLAAMTG